MGVIALNVTVFTVDIFHWWLFMQIKRILTILRDLFMPQPRNNCPHCGGIRCIGVCQFNEKQPVESGNVETAQSQQGLPQEGEKSPLAGGQNAAGQCGTGSCEAGQPVSAAKRPGTA